MREICKRPGCGGEITPIINTCKRCGLEAAKSSPLNDLDHGNGIVLGNRCDCCNAIKSRKIENPYLADRSQKSAWLCFDCYQKQQFHRYTWSDISKWGYEDKERAKIIRKCYLEKIYYGEWQNNPKEAEKILAEQLRKFPKYTDNSELKEITKNWTSDQHRQFFLEEVPKLVKNGIGL